MVYVDCKKYAQEILDAVKAVKKKKKLVILTVGDNPASESYVKGKIKDCEYCGIPYEHIKLPDDESSKRVLAVQISVANSDDSVGGIIIQLPLPKGYDEEYYTRMVRFDKDVDGFVPNSPFKPCTPEGIMYILRKELGDLTGKNALVIGRGKLVGEPLARMLLDADCTVTVAHSKTQNLRSLVWCNSHDILVTAAGKPGLVNLDLTTAGIVVDASINRGQDGKLCGDCFGGQTDYALPRMKVTPVPGGVGLMTRAMLMAHVARLEVDAL